MKDFIISIILGISLSMDAFSLSIIYGTLGLDKKKIIQLSFIVGLYHFFMPIIGFYFGSAINKIILIPEHLFIASVFFIIALEMLISIKDNKKLEELKNFFSLLLFGLSVSLDSFFIGVGFGILQSSIIISAMVFAIVSFFFTYIGLLIGNRLNKSFGNKTILIGSIILIILAIYL